MPIFHGHPLFSSLISYHQVLIDLRRHYCQKFSRFLNFFHVLQDYLADDFITKLNYLTFLRLTHSLSFLTLSTN